MGYYYAKQNDRAGSFNHTFISPSVDLRQQRQSPQQRRQNVRGFALQRSVHQLAAAESLLTLRSGGLPPSSED
jgi:hypothetical protein